NGGEIRSVPVSIHGSAYIPPLPIKSVVLESIGEIIEAEKPVIEKAIDLLLYCMKTQIFIDGNKRAAVIFANHLLLSQACGLLTVPEEKVDRFKTLLIEYYEGRDTESIRSFLKEYCWQTVD
uniref:Fic family protein n=1 Tax=Faecalibaculum rodentium TaxID=1702221 RepID=UPI0025A9A436